MQSTSLRHSITASSDTEEFERFYGCLGDFDTVTDNFLEQVGYDKEMWTKYTLSEEQYNQIDSILLFRVEIKKRSGSGSIEYYSRRYMLQRLKPKPEWYNRIREIVKDGVYEALPILAQYQNENDTVIFKTLLLDDEFSSRGRILKNYVRNSIRYFPHPSFYPILKRQLLEEIGTNDISDDYESFPLYTALVQYPTKETKLLFENALKKSGVEYKTRAKFIAAAARYYPSKVFDDLKKEEDNVIEE